MSTNDESMKHGSPEDLRREVEQSVARELSSQGDVTLRSLAATVSMNIEPEAIPRHSIEPVHVLERVMTEYRSRLDTSDLLIPQEALAGVTEARALQVAIDNDRVVRFTGGWLRLDAAERVTPIISFGFGEQIVTATVNGTSEEAEYLCKRLLLLLWQSAGIDRRWGEFEELVEVTTYRTTTVVDMGVPLARLLSNQMNAFFTEDVASADGFGREMGTYGSKIQRFGAQPRVVPHCREIDIVLSVIDDVTGEQEDCLFNLLLHSKADANRSRCKFMSELSTARHNEMAQVLVQRIRSM